MTMETQVFHRVALRQDVKGHWLRAGDVAYLVDHVEHPAGSERGGVLEVFSSAAE